MNKLMIFLIKFKCMRRILLSVLDVRFRCMNENFEKVERTSFYSIFVDIMIMGLVMGNLIVACL